LNTAKLFTNGRSQAVRLPKDCRFEGSEVYIKKYGDIVLLLPKDDPWAPLFASLDQFSEDFMEERQQPPAQEREAL
jgi:antitoxin VapB